MCLANGAVNLRLSVQGSFGVEERGSPGLRETAKALGLPDPDDDDANTLSSPESGPWSPHGEDEPQTNWKQRQEEGWAVRRSPTLDRAHSLEVLLDKPLAVSQASLPQQEPKDRNLAEAYLPPSLLQAYKAPVQGRKTPGGNRRYLDNNPFGSR